MDFWVPLLSISTTVAAAGFVIFAVLWLRKLRHTVQSAIDELADHQLSNSQRVNEVTSQLQKNYSTLEKQIIEMARTTIRLRQEVTDIAARIESAEHERSLVIGERILH